MFSRSSCPFHTVAYYIKWDTTSWTEDCKKGGEHYFLVALFLFKMLLSKLILIINAKKGNFGNI